MLFFFGKLNCEIKNCESSKKNFTMSRSQKALYIYFSKLKFSRQR